MSDLTRDDVETLSLLSSDTPGVFALDPASGAIRLMDETALADTNRTHYTPTVQATDNGTPPLSSTTTLTIDVGPANSLLATSLAAEIWTNLSGSGVSNLTSQPKFPNDPTVCRVSTRLNCRVSVTPNNSTIFLNNSGDALLFSCGYSLWSTDSRLFDAHWKELRDLVPCRSSPNWEPGILDRHKLPEMSRWRSLTDSTASPFKPPSVSCCRTSSGVKAAKSEL